MNDFCRAKAFHQFRRNVCGQRCFDTSDRDSPNAVLEPKEVIGQQHFKRGVSLVNEDPNQFGDPVFNIVFTAHQALTNLLRQKG
jgi:hypothetical protein